MANQRVNLVRNVKMDGKWVLQPVSKDKHGKPKWNCVLLPGTKEAYPISGAMAGAFHLRFREGGKSKTPTVLTVLQGAGHEGYTQANIGPDEVREAISLVLYRLEGIRNGTIAPPAVTPATAVPLLTSVNAYLANRSPDSTASGTV